MNATRAVADLIRESLKYRRFFKQCCETSAFRLRSQAWQFGEELLDWGQPFSHEDLEDALLTIARKVLPETPAAAWDVEWAGALFTADCSDDGLTAPFCRPPCLTARIVSHLLVAECMPSCVHRATRFNTIATRCSRRGPA